MNNSSVLLIWDRIGDYHRARITAMQNKMAVNRVFAAHLGAADTLYGWDNADDEHTFLLSNKKVEEKDRLNRCKNFIRIVRKHQIKTVGIPGYGRIEYIIFIILSFILGIHIVLFAESSYPRNKTTDRLKGLFLRIFCNSFFVSGSKAESHFINNLKLPGKRIATGYSVIDNNHFNTDRKTKKSNKKILLCVARFSPEKNLTTLIRSFKKSSLSNTWKLIIAGGGPLYNELKTQISENDNIELRLWVKYTELPQLYAEASIFILPSIFEPWGLVVNEACAAGLPIIASKECGCVPDLVDSQNGFTFSAFSNIELTNILNRIALTDSSEFEELGKISREKIASFSPDTWAETFLKLSKI